MIKKKLLLLAGMPINCVSKLCSRFKTKPYTVLIGRNSGEGELTYIDEFIKYDFRDDPSYLESCINNLPRDFSSVDFVYYPSFQVGRKELVHQSKQEIDTQLAVGLTSCIFLTRAILKKYSSSPGSFVIMGSEAAKFGGREISVYAAVKGGLVSFVKGLAKEIARNNKRINLISPSIIVTNTLKALYGESQINELKKTIPLGRLGNVNDLVSLIHWLLSDEASFITGSVIPLTGGR